MDYIDGKEEKMPGEIPILSYNQRNKFPSSENKPKKQPRQSKGSKKSEE